MWRDSGKEGEKQMSCVFNFSMETTIGMYDLCFHIEIVRFYALHRL